MSPRTACVTLGDTKMLRRIRSNWLSSAPTAPSKSEARGRIVGDSPVIIAAPFPRFFTVVFVVCKTLPSSSPPPQPRRTHCTVVSPCPSPRRLFLQTHLFTHLCLLVCLSVCPPPRHRPFAASFPHFPFDYYSRRDLLSRLSVQSDRVGRKVRIGL